MSENKNKTGKSLIVPIVFSVLALTSATLGIWFYLDVKGAMDHVVCAVPFIFATGIAAFVFTIGAILSFLERYAKSKRQKN